MDRALKMSTFDSEVRLWPDTPSLHAMYYWIPFLGSILQLNLDPKDRGTHSSSVL